MKEPNNLIEIFTHHKVASNLTMVLMLMAGVWAISMLNVQLNPTRTQNYVNVSIVWRGASAEDMEKLILAASLKRFHGNKVLICSQLKIPKTTLYNKLKRYGLELYPDLP